MQFKIKNFSHLSGILQEPNITQ